MTNIKNELWCEKYRPKTIDDCILPEQLKITLKQIISSGSLPNMMFCGGAGVGKTTVARALANEMEMDCLFLNASENGNIDTLRTTIRSFASTVSLQGNKKLVILDEADYLNAQSTQPALRGFIEEFNSNCKFIFTCNYKNRLIEPLHSRCSILEFNIPNKEKYNMAIQIMARLEQILKAEKVKYNKPVVAELINNYFPDIRRMLNELQRYSISGEIDTGLISSINNAGFDELFTFMKTKNFTEVRKWIATHSDLEPEYVFRNIFDNLSKKLEKDSIPSAILILADYQYKMSFSADHEICMSACLAELMMNVSFQ